MTLKSISKGFAAVLLAAAALAGTTMAIEAEAPPTAVIVKPTAPAIRVVAAEQQELVETLSITGTVVAREEAVVGTDLNGMIVTALNADEGDMVRKGDVLATLDHAMLDTQLVEIDATRAQAQANIDQVGAQIADAEVAVRQGSEALERARSLQQKGVATKAALDNAVNAFDSANARLNSARKALVASRAQLAVIDAKKQNLMLQLSKTEVKAPADGLVLSRSATLGGIVSASGSAMFRIAIDAELELAAEVSETDLARLQKGMPAKLWLAGRKDAVDGHIRRISPEVDARSRLGSVRIVLDPDSKAHVGNFGRGDIETTRREGVVVPAAAVVYRDDDAFLQRVEDGRIRTIPVSIGIRMGSSVEVLSGIEAGAEVVARAGTFVADGDMVTPVRDELTGAVAP